MDCHWLITWTTYGTWLPGDKRGFVSTVINSETETRRIENTPGTPYLADKNELQGFAASQLKCDPIYLTQKQAGQIEEQFVETANYRGWKLYAHAIMRNHIHIVVGVNGDPNPEGILRDFKAFASRKLNHTWRTPASDTWWTESGSKRKLKDEAALCAAMEYVRNQENPLIVLVRELDACEESGG